MFETVNRSHRVCLPEVMDDPSLDTPMHFQALRGLARINRWSLIANHLWAPIQRWAERTGKKSWRILDVATGGGDIPVALWHKAKGEGLALEIEGCDKSAEAITYARECAKKENAPVNFYQHDVLENGVPSGYDFILCSLFLHHLTEGQAAELLRRMAGAARVMVLVDDLNRCWRGSVLAFLGTRLLTRSKVVHIDGGRSVRAAFNISEIKELIHRAGLFETEVISCWPLRYLVVWKRPSLLG